MQTLAETSWALASMAEGKKIRVFIADDSATVVLPADAAADAGDAIIDSSFAAVTVNGNSVVGGLVGNNDDQIWNSYASAPADWCLLLARTDREGEVPHAQPRVPEPLHVRGRSARPPGREATRSPRSSGG